MNPMKNPLKSLSAALALGCAGVAASSILAIAPAQAQSDSARLDQAVAALRGISTLKANFTQTDRAGRMVRGKLTLKRPGRIRFEYDPSVNMLIVSDGKALTLIDYDVRQVQRWPIRNSPLGALLDPNRDVKRFGTLRPTANPNVISVEVRDAKHPEYGIITLIFAIAVVIPIPFGNWLPALACFIRGIALSERDGIWLAVGTITGVVAICIMIGVVLVAHAFAHSWLL